MTLKTNCGQGADGAQWGTSRIWADGHKEGIHCAGNLHSFRTEENCSTFSERDEKMTVENRK
jgi:hypothetical protein